MKSSTNRAFMAKKQTTSFAQVANNLLTVLQGYTKGIRLVAVLTLLFISGIMQVQAALRSDYTLVTNVSQITSGGTYIIAYNSGTATTHTSVVPMRNETNATVDGNSTAYIYSGSEEGKSGVKTISMENANLDLSDYEVTIVTGSGTNSFAIQLQDGNYIGFYGTSNNNVALYSSVVENCSFTLSVSNNKWTLTNVKYTSRYFKYNTSGRYSNYASNSGSTGPIVIYKKTQTCTLNSITLNTDDVQKSFCKDDDFDYTGLVVTANYAGGCASKTVNPTSVSSPTMGSIGTMTITVSYTEGNITKNATYSITVTSPYTIKWIVDGDESTEEVCAGKKVSNPPTIPSPLPCGDVFVGWTTEAYKGNSAPDPLYATADAIPAITGDQTFYAVFADYAD